MLRNLLLNFTALKEFSSPDIIFILIGITLILIFVLMLPIGTWIKAKMAGETIPFFQLCGMKLRRLPYRTIADAYIRAHKGGLDLTVDELEVHCMAGGNVLKIVNALISAKVADIPLTAQKAKMMDLKGEDVLETVKAAVREKNALQEPENNF